MRTFTHNVIVIAEHQQATKRGMEPTIFTAHRCRTNSAQKTLVIEARPRATRTDLTKTDTIRPHRISIEISNSEIAQYLGIHRFGPLIPEHCRNLLSRATIVAFTASAISSCEEIVVDIHGGAPHAELAEHEWPPLCHHPLQALRLLIRWAVRRLPWIDY